jgi:O-antigen/teichoic acid export membrane protein
MEKLTKYITNISAFQFSQLCRFGSLFLIGVILVRCYSTSDIGLYETLIFIAGAVSFFWLWGILQTFISLSPETIEIKENRKFKNKAYFNAFVLLLIFSALTILFLIIFKHSISHFLNDNKKIPFFKWLLLYILFSSPANLTEYIYLDLHKPKHIIIYSIVSNGVQFVFLSLSAILDYPIETTIMFLVFANVLKFIWLIILIGKHGYFTIDTKFIKQNLYLAAPIIGSSILSGSGPYVDGLIITHYFDSATFAIFRYGAREFPLAVILTNALTNSLIPEFYSSGLEASVHKLYAQTKKLMHLIFPLTIFFLLTSKWLYIYLFSPDFLMSARIFNIYLLLTIPRFIAPNTILLGLKNTKPIFWISLTEIITNIAASLILVKFWGVTGVVFGTIISFVFERSLFVFITRKNYGISFKEYIPRKIFFIYSVLTIFAYIFAEFFITH